MPLKIPFWQVVTYMPTNVREPTYDVVKSAILNGKIITNLDPSVQSKLQHCATYCSMCRASALDHMYRVCLSCFAFAPHVFYLTFLICHRGQFRSCVCSTVTHLDVFEICWFSMSDWSHDLKLCRDKSLDLSSFPMKNPMLQQSINC